MILDFLIRSAEQRLDENVLMYVMRNVVVTWHSRCLKLCTKAFFLRKFEEPSSQGTQVLSLLCVL